MTEKHDAPEPVRFTRDNPAAQGPHEGYWLTRMGNDAQGNALWGWMPIPGYADAPVNLDEFMRGYLAEHPDANMPAWRERQNALALAAADALADVVHAWEEKEDGYVFDLVDWRDLSHALWAYREARGARSDA